MSLSVTLSASLSLGLEEAAAEAEAARFYEQETVLEDHKREINQ